MNKNKRARYERENYRMCNISSANRGTDCAGMARQIGREKGKYTPTNDFIIRALTAKHI